MILIFFFQFSALNGYICGPNTPLVELKYQNNKTQQNKEEGNEGEDKPATLHAQFPAEIKVLFFFFFFFF